MADRYSKMKLMELVYELDEEGFWKFVRLFVSDEVIVGLMDNWEEEHCKADKKWLRKYLRAKSKEV